MDGSVHASSQRGRATGRTSQFARNPHPRRVHTRTPFMFLLCVRMHTSGLDGSRVQSVALGCDRLPTPRAFGLAAANTFGVTVNVPVVCTVNVTHRMKRQVSVNATKWEYPSFVSPLSFAHPFPFRSRRAAPGHALMCAWLGCRAGGRVSYRRGFHSAGP